MFDLSLVTINSFRVGCIHHAPRNRAHTWSLFLHTLDDSLGSVELLHLCPTSRVGSGLWLFSFNSLTLMETGPLTHETSYLLFWELPTYVLCLLPELACLLPFVTGILCCCHRIAHAE